MLYNDLADQIPEDYVFIDLQKITSEGVVLASELKKAGQAGPTVIAIAESGGEILAAIAGIMRGSMSAIVFLIWIIFKIVCRTLWLGSTSKTPPVVQDIPVVEEVIQPQNQASKPAQPIVAEDINLSVKPPRPDVWASDDDLEDQPNVVFTKTAAPFVVATETLYQAGESEEAIAEPILLKTNKQAEAQPKKESWLNTITGGKL